MFNGPNTKGDDEKNGLTPRSETQVSKMKSLRKIVIKKDIEIKALKAKVDILEDDLEKYRALGLESIETMLSQWAD